MYFRLGARYPRHKSREPYPNKKVSRRFLAAINYNSTIKLRSLSNSLSLTQTLTLTKISSVPLSNTLFLTQTVHNATASQSLTQTLGFTQSLTFAVVHARNLTNTLSLTHDLTVDTFQPVARTINQTINFTHNLTFLSSQQRNLVSDIFLTQILTKKHVVALTLTDHLAFTQTASKNQKYIISVSNHLTFKEGGFNRSFGSTQVFYPDIIAIVPKNYVILRGFNRSIILPSPAFGDSEGSLATLTVNRAVNGTIYSYVKSTSRRKLTYKFTLPRQKIAELETFIDVENIKEIELINWKGEIWYVKLITNPVIFTAVSRGERHEVEMTFEGYRVA